MDEEEKELFRKLLAKVENLEKEVKATKETSQVTPKEPQLPPMPHTNDRFERLVLERARERARQGLEQKHYEETVVRKADDLKKNFDVAEILQFAIKKRMLKEGKEANRVSGEEAVKVYEE